jgi:outer membrane biogenesis lipoprotein LolB
MTKKTMFFLPVLATLFLLACHPQQKSAAQSGGPIMVQ